MNHLIQYLQTPIPLLPALGIVAGIVVAAILALAWLDRKYSDRW